MAWSRRIALLSVVLVVIDLDKEFQEDYNGAGQIANNMSYT